MGTWLLAPELGSDCWAFVDNVGAEFALRKGFSRDRDANAVISLFWGAAALTGVRPWFERVPSKAQLADEVSRGDDSLILTLGSRRLDFDYTGIWQVVVEMIGTGGLANHEICSRLVATVSEQRRKFNLPP